MKFADALKEQLLQKMAIGKVFRKTGKQFQQFKKEKEEKGFAAAALGAGQRIAKKGIGGVGRPAGAMRGLSPSMKPAQKIMQKVKAGLAQRPKGQFSQAIGQAAEKGLKTAGQELLAKGKEKALKKLKKII